jgi:hypothetical protein
MKLSFRDPLPPQKLGAHSMMTMGLNIECQLTNNDEVGQVG